MSIRNMRWENMSIKVNRISPETTGKIFPPRISNEKETLQQGQGYQS